MASNMRSSTKNRVRKPQQRSLPLRSAILAVAREYDRMSVRQLFYQLVTRGHIEKTEQGYRRMADVTVQLRRSGELPYAMIVDGHRDRQNAHINTLDHALAMWHNAYRRDLWLDQTDSVEVWCEKDALSGIIAPICYEYRVTYVAVRGFASVSLLYDSAQAMIASGRHTHLYYFGDHDSSGRIISDAVSTELHALGAPVTVRRMAIEPHHIAEYDLPTRPNKTSDSRHDRFVANYGDAAVELDALPPSVLTDLVRQCIVAHIDPLKWSQQMRIEQLERETLSNMGAYYSASPYYNAPLEIPTEWRKAQP